MAEFMPHFAPVVALFFSWHRLVAWRQLSCAVLWRGAPLFVLRKTRHGCGLHDCRRVSDSPHRRFLREQRRSSASRRLEIFLRNRLPHRSFARRRANGRGAGAGDATSCRTREIRNPSREDVVIASLLLLRLRVSEIRRFVIVLTKDELTATVQQKRTRTCL